MKSTIITKVTGHVATVHRADLRYIEENISRGHRQFHVLSPKGIETIQNSLGEKYRRGSAESGR